MSSNGSPIADEPIFSNALVHAAEQISLDIGLGEPSFSSVTSHDTGKPSVFTTMPPVQYQPSTTLLVGLSSNTTLSITISSPSNSELSNSALSNSASSKSSSRAWHVTVSVSPQFEIMYDSYFSSLGNSMSRSTGSMRSSLVSNSLASRSLGSAKDLRDSQNLTWQPYDLRLMAETSATQAISSATLRNSNSTTASQVQDGVKGAQSLGTESAGQTAPLLMAAKKTGGNGDLNFDLPLTNAEANKFPLFETDSFGLLRRESLVANSAADQLTATFATLFSAEQRDHRARPLSAHQTAGSQKPAARESDLILSGKQGPREQDEALNWSRGVDAFFLRGGNKHLLTPQGRDTKGEKSDSAKPNVPGSNGKAAPGVSPQKQKDDSGSSDRHEDPAVKQGSMTWVGLAVLASGGFKMLRNRRRKQTNAL